MGQKHGKNASKTKSITKPESEAPMQIFISINGPQATDTLGYLAQSLNQSRDSEPQDWWTVSPGDDLVEVPSIVRFRSSHSYSRFDVIPHGSFWRHTGCYVILYDLSAPEQVMKKQLNDWLRNTYAYGQLCNYVVMVGTNPEKAEGDNAKLGADIATKFELDHYIVSVDRQEEVRSATRSIIASTYLHLSQGRELNIMGEQPRID